MTHLMLSFIIANIFLSNYNAPAEIRDISGKHVCANVAHFLSTCTIYTSDRRQSKTFLTISERGSKVARNNVFDCRLSPVGRQMAIENSFSTDF